MNNIKLTDKNLHALGTNGKGFNKKQLHILGISWPPKGGWLKQLIGTEITNEQYQTLLSLRNAKQNGYISKETPLQRKPQQQPVSDNQYINLLRRCKAELMFPLDELTPLRQSIITEIDTLCK